jgi:hypothetical protein
MTKSFKRGAVVASIALLAGWLSSAANATVYIEVNGSGTLATDPTSATLNNYSTGNFTINSVNGTAFPAPDYLSSNTIGGSTTGGGTLTIDVTVTGLTQSLPLFLSAFGSNVLNGGLTLTEQTYLDTANGIFATTTLLGSQTFTGGGFTTQYANVGNVSSPFSITEVYTISGTGAGNFNANIDVSAVPEPSTWAMLILGFLGVGFTAYRRKFGSVRVA